MALPGFVSALRSSRSPMRQCRHWPCSTVILISAMFSHWHVWVCHEIPGAGGCGALRAPGKFHARHRLCGSKDLRCPWISALPHFACCRDGTVSSQPGGGAAMIPAAALATTVSFCGLGAAADQADHPRTASGWRARGLERTPRPGSPVPRMDRLRRRRCSRAGSRSCRVW